MFRNVKEASFPKSNQGRKNCFSCFGSNSDDHLEVFDDFVFQKSDYIALTAKQNSSLKVMQVSQKSKISEAQNIQSTVLDSMDIAVLSKDLNHVVIACNKLAARLFGFSKEEIIGKHFSELVPGYDDLKEAELKERFSLNDKLEPVEISGKSQSDGLFHVMVKLFDWSNESGEIIGTTITCKKTEIDRHSKANIDLAHKRLALHHENAPLGVIEWTNEMEIISWSSVAEDIFEWDAKEVIGKKLNELNLEHPDDQKRVKREVLRLLTGKKGKVTSTNRNTTKSGRVIVCEWRNSVLTDADGKVISVLSFILDITESIKQEKILKRNELQLKQAQEIAEIASWELDTETNEVYWSDTMRSIIGRDEDFKTEDAHLVYSPEDWIIRKAAQDKALLDGTPYALEFMIICPNGEKRWIDVRGTRRESNKKGKYILFGTVQNITNRVLANKKIEENRTHQHLVLDGMRDGILLLDKDFRILLFNDLAKEIIKSKYPKFTIAEGEILNQNISEDFHNLLLDLKSNKGLSKPFTIPTDVELERGVITKWMTSIFPLTDDDFELEHIIIRVSNIDEESKMRAEREFEALHKDALINSTEDFIWSYDLNFNLLSANKAFLNIYNLSDNRDPKSGEHIDFISPFEKDWKKQSLRAFEGESFTAELHTFIQSIKLDIYLEASFNPIIQNDIVVGAACFARVINQRKAQENKLREATYFLQRAQKVAHVGHWIYRSKTENPSFQCSAEINTILGKQPEEKPSIEACLALMHPDDTERVSHSIQTAIEQESSFITEARIRVADGSYRWIEISAETDRLELSDESALLGVMKDIDFRVKSQLQIQSLNADLEKIVELRTAELQSALKELESFTYSVSHDLRAPLRGMHGYANMIMEDFGEKLEPEAIRLVETIKANARQMGQLIDDLLEFSRLGKKEISKTLVLTQPIIEKSIAENKSEHDSKPEFLIETLHPVLADKSLISVVFANIISNAIKYSSKVNQPMVKISSEIKEDLVIYAIEDNGAGFDMAYYKKLFGVFQRLHSHQEFSGTGVGLAVVEKIIKKHGGEIWAESEVGKGATFYFSLPTLR